MTMPRDDRTPNDAARSDRPTWPVDPHDAEAHGIHAAWSALSMALDALPASQLDAVGAARVIRAVERDVHRRRRLRRRRWGLVAAAAAVVLITLVVARPTHRRDDVTTLAGGERKNLEPKNSAPAAIIAWDDPLWEADLARLQTSVQSARYAASSVDDRSAELERRMTSLEAEWSDGSL